MKARSGRRLAWLLSVSMLVVAGCSPAPVPTTTTAAPTAAPTTSPAAETGARLAVTFAGTVHCASIQSGCGPTLSILPASTALADDWRPPATDPRWAPDYSTGWSPDHFDPTPLAALPRIPIGRHEIVISLLGSSDVPSYGPDGGRVFDLLGRCVSDVDVGSATGHVQVLVTFTPDRDSFQASCTLALKVT